MMVTARVDEYVSFSCEDPERPEIAVLATLFGRERWTQPHRHSFLARDYVVERCERKNSCDFQCSDEMCTNDAAGTCFGDEFGKK